MIKKAIGAWCAFWCLACIGGNKPPKPDSCLFPDNNVEVEGLRIGGDDWDAGGFVVWKNGDEVSPTLGRQGGWMLMVRIKVEEGGPDCLAQQTQVFDVDGDLVGESTTPLKTSTDVVLSTGDDAFALITDELAFVLDQEPIYGEPITVTTTAGESSVTRTIVWRDYYDYRSGTGQTGDTSDTDTGG